MNGQRTGRSRDRRVSIVVAITAALVIAAGAGILASRQPDTGTQGLARASGAGAVDAAPQDAAAAVATVDDVGACSRYASPNGADGNDGSETRPYLTIEKLMGSLTAAQPVGCLLSGIYRQYADTLTIVTDAITLRAAPGADATVRGYLRIPASEVTVAGLTLDGTRNDAMSGYLADMISIEGDRVRLIGNDITTSGTTVCVNIGAFSDPANGVVVDGNLIHGCGSVNDPNRNREGNQVHGVYVDYATGTRVTNNFIFNNAGRGVQMAPDADGTSVVGNIIDQNGTNVQFGGDCLAAPEGASYNGGTIDAGKPCPSTHPYPRLSEGNRVEANIITNATRTVDVGSKFNVGSYYDNVRPLETPPPTFGNSVGSNCIFHKDGADKNFKTPDWGYMGFKIDANTIPPATGPGFRTYSTLPPATPGVHPLHPNYLLAADSPCIGMGPRPGARTDPATVVAASTATLTGTVNPYWTTATYYFEYGTTIPYGSKTDPPQSAGSAPLPARFTADIDGLKPSTKYYYRLVTSNFFGIRYGADESFTTEPGTGPSPTPTLPTIAVDDTTVTEAASGVTATFTVRLSAPSSQAVSVKYATANGTALAPGDYTAAPLTTITFAAGQTTQAVSVPVTPDVRDEPPETFFLDLSAATNATIGDARGMATITDDDPPPAMTINNRSLLERDSGTWGMVFTVRLSTASAFNVTVNFKTTSDTATQPADYTHQALTPLTISAGQTSRTITVFIRADTVKEPDQRFFVDLSGAYRATISGSRGTGTIRNDD